MGVASDGWETVEKQFNDEEFDVLFPRDSRKYGTQR